MALKLMDINSAPDLSKMVIIFADDKTDVPSTGTATQVAGYDKEKLGNFSAGSVVYTSALDVGILKTDDTWNWGE